jgi:hypothetical protein
MISMSMSKEDGDRLLEDFLLNASKSNGTKECAEESYKLLENEADSQLVISLIISESLRRARKVPKEVAVFETNILSALATMYTTCDKTDIPFQFKDLFSGTDDDIINKVGKDKRLNFAVKNFVMAFYHFEDFERKYPEITKML